MFKNNIIVWHQSCLLNKQGALWQGATIHTSEGLLMQVQPRVAAAIALNGVPSNGKAVVSPAAAASVA